MVVVVVVVMVVVEEGDNVQGVERLPWAIIDTWGAEITFRPVSGFDTAAFSSATFYT